MQIPGTPSLFYLAYLLLVLPWLAFRSAGRVRAAREGTAAAPLPSRSRIFLGTLAMQLLLLWLSWRVGSGFGYELFAAVRPDARTGLVAAGGLALLLALRWIARAVRSEQERRGMAVYLLAARTPREWLFKVSMIAVAGVAEEVAYRGVLPAILVYTTGSWPLAVLLSATAFAAAHWIQGWKSMAVIFGVALVMHGVVALTGTLVVAIVLHTVYDLIASILIAKEARRFDAEAAAV